MARPTSKTSPLLTAAELPESLTFITENTFLGCNLQHVTVEQNRYAAAWCVEHSLTHEIQGQTDPQDFIITELESVMVLDSAALGEGAFSSCSSLRSVSPRSPDRNRQPRLPALPQGMTTLPPPTPSPPRRRHQMFPHSSIQWMNQPEHAPSPSYRQQRSRGCSGRKNSTSVHSIATTASVQKKDTILYSIEHMNG